VEANIDEVRGQLRRGHGESLTEGRNKAAMISVVGVGYRFSPRFLHCGPQKTRASGRDDSCGDASVILAELGGRL
jgi:hypothetical protein